MTGGQHRAPCAALWFPANCLPSFGNVLAPLTPLVFRTLSDCHKGSSKHACGSTYRSAERERLPALHNGISRSLSLRMDTGTRSKRYRPVLDRVVRFARDGLASSGYIPTKRSMWAGQSRSARKCRRYIAPLAAAVRSLTVHMLLLWAQQKGIDVSYRAAGRFRQRQSAGSAE